MTTFDDWLYLSQTQFDPENLSEQERKIAELAWSDAHLSLNTEPVAKVVSGYSGDPDTRDAKRIEAVGEVLHAVGTPLFAACVNRVAQPASSAELVGEVIVVDDDVDPVLAFKPAGLRLPAGVHPVYTASATAQSSVSNDLLKACQAELQRGKITSLPQKLEFAKANGMSSVDEVHDWMIDTSRRFEDAVLAASDEVAEAEVQRDDAKSTRVVTDYGLVAVLEELDAVAAAAKTHRAALPIDNSVAFIRQAIQKMAAVTTQAPAAWMVPHYQSFKNVEYTNCPLDMQEKIEGTVAWSPSIIGDMPPVTDKHGVTHTPRALIYADVEPAQPESDQGNRS